ncbi:flagellar hook-length control protein FliK [Halopseudomonas pelagia]|uniref:flagellar hook-length control protein FliK n=1 Tax=Halopseudomonas pelagia TaxID=553151 RepID=UPI0030DD584E|tara:strand:- start:71753 stop:73072 length:1320 start_codon:yes stop_codon:yes gene_type:complete
MSVSQNMLALFSSVPRPGGTQPTFMEPVQAGDGEGLGSFSEVLSGQQSEQLDALLTLLGEAEGDGELAALQQMQFAADGKDLPESMQGWLEQLAELSAEDGEHAVAAETDPALLKALAEDWAQWLTQARLTLNQQPADATIEAEVDVDSDLIALQAQQAQLSGFSDTRGAAVAGLQGATATAAQGNLTADQLQLSQLERELRQEAGSGSSRAERTSALEAQLQRPQDPSMAGADTRAAFTAKLTDALESLTGKRASAEPESLEALQRPGTPGQAAAQGALAARPVLATSQTLGVPFGQTGWGDALIDKMQWMSSQNLRSVEIRLDPAELGPLEIHIQTRGQEHQVQFVSQNPSVREALEAQMFRLRESFSQQGLDLVNVSVGDSAVGQQARQESDGRSAGRGEAVAAGAVTQGADEAGMSMAAEAASQAMSNRLIDYYA